MQLIESLLKIYLNPKLCMLYQSMMFLIRHHLLCSNQMKLKLHNIYFCHLIILIYFLEYVFLHNNYIIEYNHLMMLKLNLLYYLNSIIILYMENLIFVHILFLNHYQLILIFLFYYLCFFLNLILLKEDYPILKSNSI